MFSSKWTLEIEKKLFGGGLGELGNECLIFVLIQIGGFGLSATNQGNIIWCHIKEKNHFYLQARSLAVFPQ